MHAYMRRKENIEEGGREEERIDIHKK